MPTNDTNLANYAYSNKANNLQEIKNQKLETLSQKPQYTPDVLIGMSDADTLSTKELGSGLRENAPGLRYDAVELPHAGKYGEGKSPIAMSAQAEQVATLLGKPLANVTQQDMVDVGNQQQIQKLADLAGNTTGWKAPLIPNVEPTNLTGYYSDDKGTKQAIPLNVPIQSSGSGEMDKGGKRELAQFADASGVEVTKNAALDPSQNAFAPKDINADTRQIFGDSEGRLGEAIDLAQSGGVKYWGDMAAAARSGSRAVAGKLGLSKDSIDKYLPENPKLLGTDLTIEQARKNTTLVDSSVGYDSRKAWDAEKKEYGKNITNKEYGSAAWNVVTNLDRYLAESAPEMAVLMVPYVGIPSVVATRLNNQMDGFEKTNGRKMTTEEAFATAASILPSLLAEKFLVKSGATGVLNTGKSVGGRVAGVGVSGIGEGLQEGYEATQEQWATGKAEDRASLSKLGEYATSDDTVGGIIAGGVMGSGLRGMGEVAGATLDSGVIDKVTTSIPSTKNTQPPVEDRKIFDTAANAVMESYANDDIITTVSKLEELDSMAQANSELAPEVAKIKEAIRTANMQKAAEVSQGNIEALGAEFSDLDKGGKEAKLIDLVSTLDTDGVSKFRDALNQLADVHGIDKTKMSGILDGIEKARNVDKNLESVTKEVRDGNRGLASYYAELEMAKATGNDNAENRVLDKLTSFKESQSNKLNAYEEAIQEVMREVNTLSGTIPIEKIAKANKGTYGTPVKVRGQEFIIHPEVVAGGMIGKNGYSPVIVAITDEIRAIDDIIAVKPEVAKSLSVNDFTTEDFSKGLTKEQIKKGAIEVARKIKSGATEFTPNELQFRENHKKSVDFVLAKFAEKETSSNKLKATSKNKDTIPTRLQALMDVKTEEDSESWVEEDKVPAEPESIQEVKTTPTAEKLADKITKVLKMLNNNEKPLTGGNRDTLDNVESPIRAYLKDGEYTEEMAKAVTIGITQYLAERFGDLRTNDNIQISKMLGLDNARYLPATVTNALRNVGRYHDNEASGLGKVIFRALGIKLGKDVDYDLQDRIEADLGARALAILEASGLVKVNKNISANQIEAYAKVAKGLLTADKVPEFDPTQAKLTVKMTDKARNGWLETVKSNKEFLAKIEEESGIEQLTSGPRLEKKEYNKHKTRNAENWTELTKEQQKVINKAENVPFKVALERTSKLKTMWGENIDNIEELPEDKIEVAKLLGWEDPSKYNISFRDNVRSKNREIVRSIQNVIDYADSVKNKEIFFDYFFSKNGRFFIDSASINPQTDKLHRFLIDSVADNTTVTDKTRDVFKIAVVQAFDGSKLFKWKEPVGETEDTQGEEIIRDIGSIDKQSQADNIRQFEIIKDNELVKKAIKTPSRENLLAVLEGVDHPSHAIMALEELAKYSEDSEFDTIMSMETDAVTSGFVLSSLVNPVMSDYSKLKGALARGGVILGKNDFKSYGEWKAQEGNRDSYEVGADAINKMLVDVKPWLKELVGPINRKFMKSPFMTFIYGSSVTSIRRAKAQEHADNFINNYNTDTAILALTEYIEALDKDTKFGKWKIAEAKAAIQWVKKTPTKKVHETELGSVDGKYLDTVHEAIGNRVDATYGEAISGYFEEEFTEIVEARKAMNNAFIGMFGVFKDKYDRGFKEITDNKADELIEALLATKKGTTKASVVSRYSKTGYVGNILVKPSKGDVEALLADLVADGDIPGIMTVSSTNSYEKAPIMTTEVTASKDSKSKVQAKLASGDRVVNPIIREMVTNPSAGAVVNIHYLDGALIMRLIKESKGLGIHDAFVTNVNEVLDAGQNYNKGVWEYTQKFDMMKEIQKEILRVSKGNSIAKDYIWDNFVKTFGEPKGENAPTKDSMFDTMLEGLDTAVKQIDRNKARMALEGATVSNMAGPEGVEVKIEGKGIKEEAQLSSGIIDLVKNEYNNKCRG